MDGEVLPVELPPGWMELVNALANTPIGVQYPENHFLGIPLEIRREIYWHLHLLTLRENLDKKNPKWHKKQPTGWEGILRACLQTYQETQEYWPMNSLKLAQLPRKLTHDRLAFPMLRAFRHLTLELPGDYSTFDHKQVAAMLKFLAPFLLEVRIFFIHKKGQRVDGRSIRRTANACLLDGEPAGRNGVSIVESSEMNYLVKDIIIAIQKMVNLQGLVLDDINGLFLSSALMFQKLALKRLHVTTSPDNLMHPHPLGPAINPLIPVIISRACLEKLHLSANSVFDAKQLVLASLPTLREFTWTVPAHSRNSIIRADWLGQTADLLGDLAMAAKKLRVLKICMEDEISEDHSSAGRLFHAFEQSLPRFRCLEVLELHCNINSRSISNAIIRAIPTSLKRLYVTDAFVDVITLTDILWERFFGSYIAKFKAEPNHTVGGPLGFVGYECICANDLYPMLFLNGRLLDRERNSSRIIALASQHQPLQDDNTERDETFVGHQNTILLPEDTDSSEVEQMPIHELSAAKHEEDYDKADPIEQEILEKIWSEEQPRIAGDVPNYRYAEWEFKKPGDHWLSEQLP